MPFVRTGCMPGIRVIHSPPIMEKCYMRAFPVRVTLVFTVLSMLALFSGMGCRGDTPASLEPVGNLEGINIFNVPSSMQPGQVHLLGATGLYPGLATYNITAYANWVSSNPDVIQIIGKGILRAVGGGTASISASYRGVTSMQVEILVAGSPIPGQNPNEVVLTGIEISPTFIQVAEGGEVQFTALAIFSNETNQDITNLVDWRVSDDEPGFIIDADNVTAWGALFGLFKATGPVGSTVVSAAYQGMISNYATVIVKQF